MIEGLPWPVWGGLFASGWAVVALLMVNFANGRWFVSRREADALLERAKHAESMNSDLTRTLAGFTAVGQLQKAMLEAKERVVSDEPSGTT